MNKIATFKSINEKYSMLVIVGSKNPVKIDSVKEAFLNYFPGIEVRGIEVSSGVGNQPVNENTFIGAKNRAEALYKLSKVSDLGADFMVGIEGGIINIYGNWFSLGCICILNKEGKSAFGTSSHFPLPQKIIDELLKGVELGAVIDNLTDQHNSKQKSGAIGFLTKDIITRKDLYTQGIVTALIPFINPALFGN
jgi:inosine/xanthosine triphosphatase